MFNDFLQNFSAAMPSGIDLLPEVMKNTLINEISTSKQEHNWDLIATLIENFNDDYFTHEFIKQESITNKVCNDMTNIWYGFNVVALTVRFGKWKLFKSIMNSLEDVANFDAKFKKYNTKILVQGYGLIPPILAVYLAGNLDLVEYMLATYDELELNFIFTEGRFKGTNLIWLATLSKNYKLVGSILEGYADLFVDVKADITTEFAGINIAWMLAQNKQWTLWKNFIDEEKIDINAMCSNQNNIEYGKNILWHVVNHGNEELAITLVNKNTDINAVSNKGENSGKSILWLALKYKLNELLICLLNKNVDVRAAIIKANEYKKTSVEVLADQLVLDYKLLTLLLNNKNAKSLLRFKLANNKILATLFDIPAETAIQVINQIECEENLKNDCYLCTINKCLMIQPIFMSDGRYYELSTIMDIYNLSKKNNVKFLSPYTQQEFVNYSDFKLDSDMITVIAELVRCYVKSITENINEEVQPLLFSNLNIDNTDASNQKTLCDTISSMFRCKIGL